MCRVIFRLRHTLANVSNFLTSYFIGVLLSLLITPPPKRNKNNNFYFEKIEDIRLLLESTIWRVYTWSLLWAIFPHHYRKLNFGFLCFFVYKREMRISWHKVRGQKKGDRGIIQNIFEKQWKKTFQNRNSFVRIYNYSGCFCVTLQEIAVSTAALLQNKTTIGFPCVLVCVFLWQDFRSLLHELPRCMLTFPTIYMLHKSQWGERGCVCQAVNLSGHCDIRWRFNLDD